MAKDQEREPINADIKRRVRTESGFGCIFCGMPIIEYHHIIPYSVVKKHEAENLVPLCDLHHKKFHQNLIPLDEVYGAKNEPFNLTSKTIRDNFMLSKYKDLRLKMGSNIFINTNKILVINDFPLIEITKDDEGRPLLNVKFYDDKNNLISEIVDNEWSVLRDSEKVWDLTWTSGKLKINSSQKKIFLEFTVNAIENTIDLRADLFYRDISVKVRPKSIQIKKKGSTAKIFTLEGNVIEGEYGILISTD